MCPRACPCALRGRRRVARSRSCRARDALGVADRLAPDVIAAYLEDLRLDDRTCCALQEVMALQREWPGCAPTCRPRGAVRSPPTRSDPGEHGELDRTRALPALRLDLEAQEGELDALEAEIATLRQRVQEVRRCRTSSARSAAEPSAWPTQTRRASDECAAVGQAEPDLAQAGEGGPHSLLLAAGQHTMA